MKKQLLSLLLSVALLSLCHTHTQAQTPALWGMTFNGGANGEGNIFEYTPSGGIIDTCDFNSNGSDAESGVGALIKAYDGLLYGMTYKNAGNTDGAIISYNPLTNIQTNLHSFGAGEDGAYPNDGALLEASDSVLYGLTQLGGANGEQGVIFSYTIGTATEKVLHVFGAGLDGRQPQGSLIQASNGLLYGTTSGGGLNGYGTIFSYNILADTELDVYDFKGFLDNDGADPYGSLTAVSDSVLYGMTFNGGANSQGTIFSFNILKGKETDKYDFYSNGLDGAQPWSSLLKATNGLLYGLTSEGGDDEGTIFSFNMQDDSEKVLHIFGNDNDGSSPYGDVIQASNGLLYGMTSVGGANGDGIIFSYNIDSGTETDIYDFSSASGYGPIGDLLEDDVTTGINQLTVDNEQLTVYPNPSSDYINVDLTGQQTQPVQLSLYNILGQEVYSTLTPPNTNSNLIATVPVTNLAEGVYVLKLNSGGVVQEKEIMVAH